MKRLRYRNQDVDAVDARLLRRLEADGRASIADLARMLGMAAPSVAERLKRLEEAGVIRRFSVEIDPAALGYALAAYIRIRPTVGQTSAVAKLLAELPEIVECDRITGDDCFIARAHLRSVEDLERLIDRIIPFAQTNTSIIQSSPVRRRLPPLNDERGPAAESP
jgi:Lrp/AsnC family leucine-responsive transcriptional regulator